MRRALFIICVGTMITVLACCKNDSIEKNKEENTIVGTWELRQAQTGMMPTVNYNPGNGNILKYTDVNYEMFTNGVLTKSGTFVLVNDTTAQATVGIVVTAGQFTDRIVYDNDLTAPKKFLQVVNNKLTFLSGYFPLDYGSKTIYERIQ